MGEAAGIAGAWAAGSHGGHVRSVLASDVQAELRRRGGLI
jgi:hypothetical protein